MPPTQILLLRHAEKPDDAATGVKEDGSTDKESLIVDGWQRTGTWTTLFGTASLRATFGVPQPNFVFASARADKGTDSDGKKDGSKSRRPVETVTPLASLLNLTIDQTYTLGQESDLVPAVMALSGNVLICWQHQAIPTIASLIVGPGVVIPSPWPGDRFDVVWMFTAATSGWTFTQVCPALMAGDSTQPIT